jgi:uncharacterized membrane protein YoaK (UPF0700 family)
MSSHRHLSGFLLAFAGACVDAIAIVAFNVLVAAQTGNTILFAVAIARGDFVTGLSSAVSIATFVAGALVGQALVERLPGAGVRAVLVAEAAVLAGLLLVWLLFSPGAVFVVACSALAMGLQSAAALNLHTGPTTYMTGLLTSVAADFARLILRRTRPPAAGGDEGPNEALVWTIYLGGAIASGAAFLKFGPVALVLPLAALAAVALGVPSRK